MFGEIKYLKLSFNMQFFSVILKPLKKSDKCWNCQLESI